MASSLRRAPVPPGSLRPGTLALAADTAHYIVHVLRLAAGDALELFDGQGQVAVGVLQAAGDAWELAVESVRTEVEAGPRLTLAVAAPKGDRAEWLLEKCTELGAARIVWLVCGRSVVIPRGGNKAARWLRVAEQAARQAGRATVPAIDGPLPLGQFMAADDAACKLIAQPGSAPLRALGAAATCSLLIGPEGGFTPEELQQAATAGYTAASLGRTILRIETAAVAGAALLLAPCQDFQLAPTP